MQTKIIHAKDIVIKIGTSSISYPNGRLNFKKIKSFVNDIGKIHKQGKKVILVSSGAIGVGAGKMGLSHKPERLSEKQALAAIGQAELINIYRKFFKELSINVGQVLLTKDIINNEITARNAQNTLRGLISMGIIPIINENDTVSTEEILIGDNDSLSAEVAILSKSKLLIILSDIDGLYSANPRTNPDAYLIKHVYEITDEIEELSKGKGSTFGTGGMQTKITAAKKCLDAGIHMIIAKFEAKVLQEIFEGKEIGTFFSK